MRARGNNRAAIRHCTKTMQLNLTLLLDKRMADLAGRLAPHLWVFSLETPHQISNTLELQGPVVDTIANWRDARRRKMLRG